MVPKYLDEEGDFVLACSRTCEGNLWETMFSVVSYKTTFWLELPSWLLKVPISASMDKAGRRNLIVCGCYAFPLYRSLY